MGTVFRIILYAPNQSVADKASQAAFQRIAVIDHSMSDYLESSEVSLLSRQAGNGKKIKISNDLWKVLKHSKRWSKKTKGAFDVSIGPLSRLWRKAFRRKAFPDALKVIKAKEKVNYRWIGLYLLCRKAMLKKPGMRLDLGGIAKGYAIDEAAKTIKSYGIRSVLVDGGGDIICAEAPPDSSGWKVLVKMDRLKDIRDTMLNISNIAIATSGDAYQYLEYQGMRYSHIIDPRTGYGVKNKGSVTVVATDCMLADILASSFSILSEQEAEILKKKKALKQIEWLE